MADSPERIDDAVAPPPHHPRFPLVDGVRALAAVSVLVSHAYRDLPDALDRLVGRLDIGVTFFFVVSGFLLYRPFIAWRAGGASAPAFRDYGRRRFLRIYPAYWVALTVLTLLPGFVGVESNGAVGQYALVHTLPIVGGPNCFATRACDIAQTWTLVIELSFYLALPLFALASARLGTRLKLSTWVAVHIGVLATLAIVSLLLTRSPWGATPSPWVSRTVIGAFPGFAVGMAFAVLSVGATRDERSTHIARRLGRHPGVIWALAAAIYVAVCFWRPPNFFPESWIQAFGGDLALVAVGGLVFIPALFGPVGEGWPRRLLGHPVVAWLGLVSYGIFLWHFAVANQLEDVPFVISVPLTLAITSAIAALSYYLVERPILRLKNTRFTDLLAQARLRARGSG